MIWLISDIHGGQYIQGLDEYASKCTGNDLLIILGDLELNFRETAENKRFTDYFTSLDCNIAFIDGNHENFDWLDSLPIEDWNGGKIHRVSKNIVHMMRGYIFNVEGYTLLTMGGCKSSQKWRDWGLCWEQELPTEEEIKRAYANLEGDSNRVDYILTHKYHYDSSYADASAFTLEGFTRYAETNVIYKHWYSGHWHRNERLDEKHTVVFDKTICIAKF